MERNYKDWVRACSEAVPGSTSPEIFRKWAAIAAVSGALGRKCWLDMGEYKIRPNLYLCFIARPGHNKSVSMKLPIKQVFAQLCEPVAGKQEERTMAEVVWKAYLRRDEGPLGLMIDRVTPEKLARTMANRSHFWVDLGISDSNMLIVTDEFGTFMDRNNGYLQTYLTRAWDSDDKQESYTKNAGDDIIKGPYLTWLAGATPEEFIRCMPANASQQGLLSRILPVYYTGKKSVMKLGEVKAANEQDVQWLTEDLGMIANLAGSFSLGDGVPDKVQELLNRVGEEEPEPMMREYATRRHAHILKTAMCISAARRNTRVIEMADFEDAANLVYEVEETMPDLLRRFGMSDAGRLIEDMYEWLESHPSGRTRDLRAEIGRRVSHLGDIDLMIAALENATRLHVDGRLYQAIRLGKDG